jgi:signal transduction histidine kinase
VQVALLTVSLLAVLALGFHVYSAAPGRSENRTFAIFAWIMALWILNDLAFFGFHTAEDDGRAWAAAALLLAIAMQLAFLRLAWVFPEPRPIPWRWAALLLLPLGVLLPVILAGEGVGFAGFRDGRLIVEISPWTYAAGAYIYALFFLGRLVFARTRRRSTDPQVRRQIGAMLLAPLFSGALVTLAVVVLPLAGEVALVPYSSLGILLGTGIYAYGVLNFRLLLPASVLDRIRLFPVTGKIALATAFASLATVGAVLAVARLAVGPGEAHGWTRAATFGVVAASLPAMGLLALVQRLLTRPIRAITEAALEVAAGRTDVRVSVGARDEVAVLGRAFNHMVERLGQDLQSLRDMGEGLLRAERLATAGAIAAGVAHEVNNPLAAVSSIVQTVRARASDARTRELLEDAVAQIERVAGALRDLMDFARARPAARRACDLNELVEATVRLLRYDRRFRVTPIQLVLDPALPRIEADPDRLQQVLLNLLFNARDALDGANGKPIAVRSMGRDGAVEISVHDEGKGIPAENLPKVFEPFFTTKQPGAGTGLGLAVSRDIVREHGGEVAIESAPERGTTVTVTLPVGKIHG